MMEVSDGEAGHCRRLSFILDGYDESLTAMMLLIYLLCLKCNEDKA